MMVTLTRARSAQVSRCQTSTTDTSVLPVASFPLADRPRSKASGAAGDQPHGTITTISAIGD